MTMNTASFATDHDRELLNKRRPWYVLALALFVLSLVVQQPLVFLAALFTLVIGLVPELWYRYALRHLVVRQQLSQQHLFFGEELTLSMSIENQKLLPLPWLRIVNDITPSLPILARQDTQLEKITQIANTWSLWSFQRVTRRYRMRCYARGFHTFGPVMLRSSDPFGWLEREAWVPACETLLVYPLIAPLEAFGLSSIHPFGEEATSRHLLEDPLRVAGVRDYQLGDDPRRIHWKATAHAGTLRSKLYEYSNQRRILLLLDTSNYSKAWMGIDREIQELSITVAASLAVWALDEGYMVGLLANSAMMTSLYERSSQRLIRHTSNRSEYSKTSEISAPGVSVPFARDHGQYERLLSLLARLTPYYDVPLEKIIDMEDAMFSLGTTVILVSEGTTLTATTVERLLDLRTRGVAIHLALTGDLEGKIMTETYDLPVHYLGGGEKWHELIENFGDEKSQAIGTGSAHLQLD
jgi:uncharacterized protein (DUF58 family)